MNAIYGLISAFAIFVAATVSGQDSASVQSLQNNMTTSAEITQLPDSVATSVLDSSITLPSDTTGAIQTDQRGVTSRIILPIVATALAGGILYLLFTQRGR